MFFFIIHIISILFIFIIKILYYTLLFTFKFIKFILSKSYLRTPIILIFLGLLFKISYKCIATFYFIYLVNILAIKLNIYTTSKENLTKFYRNLVAEIKINKKLKNINSEFILLKNLLIDEDDNIYSINHLLITNGGVFNIKMIPNEKILTDTNISKEYFFSNSTLREILPLEIPLLNILLLPESNEDISHYYNSSSPMVPINYLNDFISKKFRKPIPYDPPSIKNIILEYSLLKIDKVIIDINNFLSKNKKILIFLTTTSFVYYFYINFLTLLINYFIK